MSSIRRLCIVTINIIATVILIPMVCIYVLVRELYKTIRHGNGMSIIEVLKDFAIFMGLSIAINVRYLITGNDNDIKALLKAAGMDLD